MKKLITIILALIMTFFTAPQRETYTPRQITEMDWQEQKAIGDMDFSISPMPRTTTYGITSLFVAARGSFLFDTNILNSVF